MSEEWMITGEAVSAARLEEILRDVGDQRYHINHPFHKMMTAGTLTKGQMQAWALNRYCYQAAIPKKDAIILSRAENSEFRIEWRERIIDHDGTDDKIGGIRRWIALATGLGLDEAMVMSEAKALPATRFAVNQYLTLVSQSSFLVAVASSLTELFSPKVISERVPAMLDALQFAYVEPGGNIAPGAFVPEVD